MTPDEILQVLNEHSLVMDIVDYEVVGYLCRTDPGQFDYGQRGPCEWSGSSRFAHREHVAALIAGV